MAANHPIHIHPARPLYRFTATALGASMWFFVRFPVEFYWRLCWFQISSDVQLMYRAKKDGPALLGWKHPWDHWNAIYIAFLTLHEPLSIKNWRHIIQVILTITQWASIVSWGFMLYIQLVIFIYFGTADRENINNLVGSTYLRTWIAICIWFSCCVNAVPYQR